MNRRACTLTVAVFLASANAFCQLFENGSFDGPTQLGVAPPGWGACGVASTPDTQPGQWGVTLLASHGGGYMSLVTREPGDGLSNFVEAAQTPLQTPLKAGRGYRLKIDLARSMEFNFIGRYYNTPARLIVGGGTIPCVRQQVFWESPPIENIEWQTYTFSFVPEVDMTYFIISADFATPGKMAYGSILIDHLREAACSTAVPIATVASDATICERDGSVTLNAATPEGFYVWSTGANTPSIVVREAGKYSVTVSNGCETKAFVYNVVEVGCGCDKAVPIRTVAANHTLCEIEPVLLNAATPDGTYEWNDGSILSTLIAETPGIYTVVVSNGCEKRSFSYEVALKSCECKLSVPNVFTPDGDPFNEKFKLAIDMDVGKFDLQIFNRWGLLLFQTGDFENSWDGSVEGSISPGVYFWTADIICVDNKKLIEKKYNGWVSVIK